MNMIPKVKTVKCVPQIGTGITQDRLSSPGEYQSFQAVSNFKENQPNDYFTRKESPTSGGGKKVY